MSLSRSQSATSRGDRAFTFSEIPRRLIRPYKRHSGLNADSVGLVCRVDYEQRVESTIDASDPNARGAELKMTLVHRRGGP